VIPVDTPMTIVPRVIATTSALIQEQNNAFLAVAHGEFVRLCCGGLDVPSRRIHFPVVTAVRSGVHS
jgi:hypothetical protein